MPRLHVRVAGSAQKPKGHDEKMAFGQHRMPAEHRPGTAGQRWGCWFGVFGFGVLGVFGFVWVCLNTALWVRQERTGAGGWDFSCEDEEPATAQREKYFCIMRDFTAKDLRRAGCRRGGRALLKLPC